AEALHVTSSVNRLVVYNSGFFSFQDTILTSADRAWFFRCYIEGDTDYIWGSPSVALFEECVLVNVEGRAGHLFVSRVGRGATVPKGFVAFNSEVSTLSPNATFGRTLPSGAAPNHTTWCQAAIINSTVDGQFRNGLWQVSHDSRIGNGEHVGFKVFGLTNPDGSDFDVSNIASGTSVLERHHFEREYNGRHVILNRVFRPETGRYEFASEIWDISHWETLFNAPADPSRDNVFDSIYVEEIIVEDVSLAIGQSANVSFQVLPMDAEVRRVTWESDNPAIVGIDSDTGRITGYTGGTATITARATDGSGVYGTAAITVMANVELWTLHWDFTTVPEGWSTGDTVVVQPTDAYFGDGMTLLSRTGSDAAPTATSPDYGNGVQMVIDPNAAALAFDGDLPFTRGRMRINRGTFARIEGIQGPYTITINFHAANNAAADRFPVVKIGDVSHNLVGDPNHVPSAMGGAASQLQVRYNGTGSPVIYLKMNGGGRIWDVYIEGIREL
ncbi:MAG: pectinesterase family protein, partial [Treponema sp.]|nr:pectinesterase family protein [Treponema sp.]